MFHRTQFQSPARDTFKLRWIRTSCQGKFWKRQLDRISGAATGHRHTDKNIRTFHCCLYLPPSGFICNYSYLCNVITKKTTAGTLLYVHGTTGITLYYLFQLQKKSRYLIARPVITGVFTNFVFGCTEPADTCSCTGKWRCLLWQRRSASRNLMQLSQKTHAELNPSGAFRIHSNHWKTGNLVTIANW